MSFQDVVASSPVHPAERVIAVSLLLEGLSQNRLAHLLGIANSTLSRAKYSKNGSGKSIRSRIETRYGLEGRIFNLPPEPDSPSSMPAECPHCHKSLKEFG